MVLNIAFHVLHLLVIGLNMFGWTIPRLRIASCICQAITLSCWIGYGVVKGWWGFCPLTYWHWQVLESMGQTSLPSNYITYIVSTWFGLPMSHDFAAGLVLGCLGMAVIINTTLLCKKKW